MSLKSSKAGQWLASSASDGPIKIWSLVDGQEPLLSNLQKNTSSVFNLGFSPDQKFLITASNSEVLLWNTDWNSLQNKTCKWLQEYQSNKLGKSINLKSCS
jgi:WD40 repeat protein